jgi:hypothetical protein
MYTYTHIHVTFTPFLPILLSEDCASICMLICICIKVNFFYQFEKKKKEQMNRKDYWLHEGIVVKIVTKKLGEKYYKKKAVVKVLLCLFRMSITCTCLKLIIIRLCMYTCIICVWYSQEKKLVYNTYVLLTPTLRR